MIHLHQYHDRDGDNFMWCGEVALHHEYVTIEDVTNVTCEACLEAAADFGEKAQAQLYEIWNEQEIRERVKEPEPEHVEREGTVDSFVATAAIGALIAFGTAKLALDGFRSMFRKVKP